MTIVFWFFGIKVEMLDFVDTETWHHPEPGHSLYLSPLLRNRDDLDNFPDTTQSINGEDGYPIASAMVTSWLVFDPRSWLEPMYLSLSHQKRFKNQKFCIQIDRKMAWEMDGVASKGDEKKGQRGAEGAAWVLFLAKLFTRLTKNGVVACRRIKAHGRKTLNKSCCGWYEHGCGVQIVGTVQMEL